MDFKSENNNENNLENSPVTEPASAEQNEEKDQQSVDNSPIQEIKEEETATPPAPAKSLEEECLEAKEKYQLRHYIGITAMITVLAVLITFLVTYIVLTSKYNEKEDELKESYDSQLEALGEFKSIAELYSALPEEMRNIEMYKTLAYLDYYYRTNYVGKIDEEQLVYMIAQGYIAGTGDEYGAYYSADDFSAMLEDTEGNSVGIGVYVNMDVDTGCIRISYVMKDGPANKAGLLPGDIVTHVDGKSIIEMGYYNGIDAIKGEAGTPVTLTFVRNGESKTATLTRARVNVESVIPSVHQSDPTVGVIRIIEFNNSTPQQFKDAVKSLINSGCKTLVYDLRGNPGGTLSSVVDILDFLLPKGTIVTVRYLNDEKVVYESDDSGEEFEALYGKDIKMAVLVNGYTASAAELFTCALKDYEKAIVVGEKTYGKGCGQSVVPLPDGTGLAFTTFLYDPPRSENYNGKGIFPNVEEKLSEEASKKNIFELSHDEDNQLKAALDALK